MRLSSRRDLGLLYAVLHGAALAAAVAAINAVPAQSAPAPLVAAPSMPLLAHAPTRPIPWAIDRLVGFRGRIEYAGHRVGASGSAEVYGSALIGDDGFVLDERGPQYQLHADGTGAVVRFGSVTARTSDALDADPLLNAWAVTLAALARGFAAPRGLAAWQTASGPLVFTDQRGGIIVGAIGAAGARGASFTFEGWNDAGGVPYPNRIVRLRNGVTDATFAIDRFTVAPLPAGTRVQPAQVFDAQRVRHAPSDGVAGSQPGGRVTLPFPWLPVTTAFGLMLLAVAIVAWLRRDAFTLHICERLAGDPRDWQQSPLAAYVSPDGILLFEGNEYRVGAEFYARSVEVEHSALFLRVRAPGVSHAPVFPRRLPNIGRLIQPRRRITRARRAASAGLSLIEALVAVAFFAIVVVGAVYPALTAVARADFVAAQKRAALVAAANALTDEELACEYGTATPTGSTSSTINGFTVTVVVSDSAVAGARDILVSAADTNGTILARLATTVGPPVPVPGSTAPPLPPASPSPAPHGTPTPAPTATIPIFGGGGPGGPG